MPDTHPPTTPNTFAGNVHAEIERLRGEARRLQDEAQIALRTAEALEASLARTIKGAGVAPIVRSTLPVVVRSKPTPPAQRVDVGGGVAALILQAATGIGEFRIERLQADIKKRFNRDIGYATLAGTLRRLGDRFEHPRRGVYRMKESGPTRKG